MGIKYERGTLGDELKSACLSVRRSAFRVQRSNSGGDDRIRTCDRLLTYNGLANRRLQPLGHISATAKTYSSPRAPFVKPTPPRPPRRKLTLTPTRRGDKIQTHVPTFRRQETPSHGRDSEPHPGRHGQQH